MDEVVHKIFEIYIYKIQRGTHSLFNFMGIPADICSHSPKMYTTNCAQTLLGTSEGKVIKTLR